MHIKRSVVVLFVFVTQLFLISAPAFALTEMPETVPAVDQLSFNPLVFILVLLAVVTMSSVAISIILGMKFNEQKKMICQKASCQENPATRLADAFQFDYREFETPEELTRIRQRSLAVEEAVNNNQTFVSLSDITFAQSSCSPTAETKFAPLPNIRFEGAFEQFPKAAEVLNAFEQFPKPAEVLNAFETSVIQPAIETISMIIPSESIAPDQVLGPEEALNAFETSMMQPVGETFSMAMPPEYSVPEQWVKPVEELNTFEPVMMQPVVETIDMVMPPEISVPEQIKKPAYVGKHSKQSVLEVKESVLNATAPMPVISLISNLSINEAAVDATQTSNMPDELQFLMRKIS